ncbi:MAG: CDP-alcohol phosphatidyltransferase family protein, partial [Candidatus Methanomethylicota archaeon]
MLERLRIWVKRFIEPIALGAAKIGLTPNVVSVLGFFTALVSAYLVVRGNLIFAAIFVIISGFLDVLDGAIARVTGRVTKFGGFLDSLLDRYSDVVILSSIIYTSLCPLFW